MRIPELILAIVTGTLLMAPAGAQDRGNLSIKKENEKRDGKVEELQKERLATLKTIADLSNQSFKDGEGSLEAALQARVQLFEAELDAAVAESDRIALHQNLVDVLKNYEELAKQRLTSGAGAQATFLTVKARRLEAEIELARAKNAGQEHENVVVTTPEVKDVVIPRQFVCQLHSRRHINVRSQQSGYLQKIPVKAGQAVKKGDVLFKVAPDLYQARLDAELAEVALAKLYLKNAEKLFENKKVSEDEVARCQARLAGAEAKAKLAERELDLTVVRAPFDGIIGRIREQQGSLVTGRDIVTTLSDDSTMWAEFNVPEALYLEYTSSPGTVQQEDVELILADGNKFPEPGKLAAITAQSDSDTGSISFRAEFPNPDGLLRRGMTGNLLIRQTFHNAIVIPQRSTFEKLGKQYVYVVDEEDVAHQRDITITHELADGFVTEKGLDANDRIVLDGVRQVHAGEKVEYEFRKP